MSHIQGLDARIKIRILENGKWQFAFKPAGNRDSIQDCWEKMLDANRDIDAAKRARLKSQPRD